MVVSVVHKVFLSAVPNKNKSGSGFVANFLSTVNIQWLRAINELLVTLTIIFISFNFRFNYDNRRRPHSVPEKRRDRK